MEKYAFKWMDYIERRKTRRQLIKRTVVPVPPLVTPLVPFANKYQ